MKKVFTAVLALAVLAACNSSNQTKKTKQAVEPDKIVTVERDSTGYKLSLKENGNWQIAYKNWSEQGNWSASRTAENNRFTVEYTDMTNRLLFRMVSPDTNDTVYVSEYRLIMDGAPNFRELGGIVNKQGKQIRWGQFYRAGALAHLSEQDWKLFSDMGIATVIDFRTPMEIEREKDAFPEGMQVNYVHAMIGNPANMTGKLSGKPDSLTVEQAREFMTDGSRGFVESITDFKPVFDAMLADPAKPFLFHCTAGKDRTGMAAALILMTLDVDRSKIMDNYLLSNKYALPYYQNNSNQLLAYGFRPEVIDVIGGVDSVYLQTSFDLIDAKYGGIEKLLADEFGISPEQRQQLIDRYTY